MKKARRIIALVGVALLLLLYVSTLIFALLDSPLATSLFKTSLVLSIVLPIIIYFVTMAMKNGTDLFEEVDSNTDKESTITTTNDK